MSTRYVWERHETNKFYTAKATKVEKYTYTLNTIYSDIVASTGDYYKIKDYDGTPEFSVQNKNGDFGYWVTVTKSLLGGAERYLVPSENLGTSYPEMVGIPDEYGTDYYTWLFERNGNTIETRVRRSDSYDYILFNLYRPVFDHQEMGDFIGLTSSSNRSAYPDNGVSGDYWLLYKGSDNIDPSGLSYSKSQPQAGESVGVSATPRQPTYGGTIYYQFSYSTNGGRTWTNAGSKTTATSVNITIPEGAAQFQVRVIASDGWGFTSNTPVYGANLSVYSLKAYATVNGVHRVGWKMYATINGKVREVTKGYVTVNGIIRKMF